jgi:hypothetical protein
MVHRSLASSTCQGLFSAHFGEDGSQALSQIGALLHEVMDPELMQ